MSDAPECACGHPVADHTAWWDDPDQMVGGMGCTRCDCTDPEERGTR